MIQKSERPLPPPEAANEEFLPCFTDEACFNRGKEAEKNGKRERAKAYLELVVARYPDSPWFQRAEYLLGKWKIESKSPNGASFLTPVRARYPEMEDYVAKLLADAAFYQGDFLEAVQGYDHLLVVYPDTVLRPQALFQRGESLLGLKDFVKSAQTFEIFLRENPKDEKAPDAMSRLLDIYSENQEWERAGRMFREILWKYPDTAVSQEAEKKLSRFNLKPADHDRFKLSFPEQFSKGKALYETGRFDRAIETWKALSKKTKGQESFLAEMELKSGLALLPSKRYSEATGHFNQVLKTAPASEFGQEALLGLVRIAVRDENEPDLLKYQKKGELLFPRQEAYYKILYLVGAYFEDHHQADRARTLYQAIVKEFPESSEAPDALWKVGWMTYREGDNAGAVELFSRLLEEYSATPLQAQVLYWKSRAMERLGEVENAQTEFKKLCQNFGHSYYCHLAKKRIVPPAEETLYTSSSGDPLAVPSEGSGNAETPAFPFQKDPHYAKARELMLMGLNPEASRELNVLTEHFKDKASLLQIDMELIRAGDFFHALKNLRAQFPDILDRGKTYEFPLLWKLAYPKEVLELINKIVKNIGIEPQFVAGIMREESVFDLKAVSRSGAMGLMQLMPFTGEWVAQQLGVASFVREKLYDEEMNIRFGAYYLDYLSQRFQGNLVYTAASYNAGPEAVNKWIGNGNFTDLEEFVENIPYPETRYYVKRVIKSYEEFKEVSSLSN